MSCELVDNLLRYLASKKIGSFEVYYMEEDHLLADAKGGKIESLDESSESGIAVRVIEGGRLGFSYAAAIDEERVKACANAAIGASRVVEPDEAWCFAAPASIAPLGWKCYDEGLVNIPVTRKADIARRLEDAALKTDARIRKVRRAVIEESRLRVRLINSLGVDLYFEKTLLGSEVTAVAESDGDSEWATDLSFSHTLDGLDIEGTGRRAAERAIALLGAKGIPTAMTIASLHPFVMAQFLREFSRGFFADNIYKKKSSLVGRLGERLCPSVLNIVNNGLKKGGYGSSPFDGEGHPSVKTYLIEEGVVKNWLANIYWGKKVGIPSTGSSRRDSIRVMPAVGVSNLYIEEGSSAPDQLLKEMGTGFYVTGVIGAHTVNPITGEFSVGAEGIWYENGQPLHAVKGVIISGNLSGLFANVLKIANDLRFIGRAGSPTVMVSDIQVSGDKKP